ncbi:PDZ domain-containing protein [Acidobacteriota bacterium]
MRYHSTSNIKRVVFGRMKDLRSSEALRSAYLLKGFISLIFVFFLIAPLSAQGTRLLQQPSVSKSHIVFVHAGDVWIVSRNGGVARQLTSFPDVETYPFLSPDGKLVAFSAKTGGNTDVFVVPVEGGEAQRLTWHPGTQQFAFLPHPEDAVRGWTVDGKRVLFASQRNAAPIGVGGSPKIWSIGLEGGLPNPLPMPHVNFGMFSPDGRRFAYQMIALNDVEWRNYRGGQVRPIWVIDMNDFSLEKLPWENSNDVHPVWLDQKIYFLSDRDFAMNIYAYDTKTKELDQITHYTDFDVKYLGAGGGVVIYEQAGYLHIYDPSAGTTKQVEIEVRSDLPGVRQQWIDVSPQIANASLSPTGKRALFESRGEVFTVPVKKGNWRNLTSSPGVADRNPVWSPDGKHIAWFSDAMGEYQLMIGTQDGLSVPRSISLDKPTFYDRPVWSPDSERIAFTDVDRQLWICEVSTGVATVADQEKTSHPGLAIYPVWSPDSKWIAYTKRLSNGFSAVNVFSITKKQVHLITEGLADVISPAWDKNGKYLWFLASTNLALRSQWIDMSNYEQSVERGLYLVVLRKDEESPLLPESDEEVSDSATEAEKKPGDEIMTVRIDFEGIERRVLPVGVPLRDYITLQAGPEGVVFYAERVPRQPGLTLHKYELKIRTTKPFISPVQTHTFSADGMKLLYQSGPVWGVVDTTAPAKVGDGKIDTALQMRVDPRAEWQQIFREGWRYQRDFFYAPNLHGADWDEVYRMYEPWVGHVGHRSDLTYLLDILGGEVSVGHSFSMNPFPLGRQGEKIGLLGADIESENGYYRIKRIYTGENWNPDLRAPLDAPGIDVREGEYILEVNNQEVRSTHNFYSFFGGMAGRQISLRINSSPSKEGSRLVTVVPVAYEYPLRLRRWVEDNRRKVDKLSGGKLAYVYLPNTSGAGYTYFNRYYFSQQDKLGVILDERNHGGGHAADYMVQIMDRKLVGFFSNRVDPTKPSPSPRAGIWGPKVMIINSNAGSGGDMLPYMFRELKLGPLVGTRTWGGLVATGGMMLMDGGILTAPRPAFLNTEGKFAVENYGVAPDIEVEQTPAEVIKGHDPQLERAVEEGLRLLEGYESPIKKQEPWPVRVKRPKKK